MNQEDSPFFLTPGSASQNCWYRRIPMGINKLYGIMNEMKIKAGIVDPRITPYSARKRLIQKLNDAGVPPNQIIQISGHKKVDSLNDYSALNNEQSRGISDIITNKPPSAVAIPNTATPPVAATSTMSAPMPGFFVNSHFHGNVTFNFKNRNETQNLSQLTQQVMPPQCSRPAAVDSETPRVAESPISSPVIPPNRSYKRIRLYPESDSD